LYILGANVPLRYQYGRYCTNR